MLGKVVDRGARECSSNLPAKTPSHSCGAFSLSSLRTGLPGSPTPLSWPLLSQELSIQKRVHDVFATKWALILLKLILCLLPGDAQLYGPRGDSQHLFSKTHLVLRDSGKQDTRSLESCECNLQASTATGQGTRRCRPCYEDAGVGKALSYLSGLLQENGTGEVQELPGFSADPLDPAGGGGRFLKLRECTSHLSVMRAQASSAAARSEEHVYTHLSPLGPPATNVPSNILITETRWPSHTAPSWLHSKRRV